MVVPYVAVVYGAYFFFRCALFPMADYQVVQYLQASKRFDKRLFGRQRLFGCVGHGVTQWLVSWTVKKGDFSAMYVIITIMSLLLVAVQLLTMPATFDVSPEACVDPKAVDASAEHGAGGEKGVVPVGNAMRQQVTSKSSERQATSEPSCTLAMDASATAADTSSLQSSASLGSIEQQKADPRGEGYFATLRFFLQPAFLFFLFVVFFNGIGKFVVTHYQVEWFDENQVTFKTSGNAGLVRMLIEIVLFFHGKSMLTHLGEYWMLIVCQAASMIRLFTYAQLRDSSLSDLAYFAEALKGISSASFITACVNLMADLAPAWHPGIHRASVNITDEGRSVAHKDETNPSKAIRKNVLY